jgi:hypothetical protein
LVTDQNKALVEYAIADTDKDIFVSKYILQLPNKEKLESFVNNELKNWYYNSIGIIYHVKK